jgi:hypothetical protein
MKDPTINEIMKLKHETEHVIAQALIRFYKETNIYLTQSPEIEYQSNIAEKEFNVRVELLIPNPFKDWYLTWTPTASTLTHDGQ